MSNALYQEIKEIFNQRKEEGSWADFSDFLLGRGDVKGFEFIEQDGGGEGGAEYCETVFKLDGEFIKVTFSYQSYNGFDFDYAEAFKVTPKEKTITVYE